LCYCCIKHDSTFEPWLSKPLIIRTLELFVLLEYLPICYNLAYFYDYNTYNTSILLSLKELPYSTLFSKGFYFQIFWRWPFSSKINSWGWLSMKIFPQLKVGSRESLRLQCVVIFNTCMMSLYHYFKPLHSEIPKLAGTWKDIMWSQSIDAWCECARVRVTSSYEEKCITGSL